MKKLNQIADKAVAALQQEGADRAQCTVSEKVTHEFNAEGGSFSLYRTLFDNSMTVTAYKDNKKGSVSINRLDDDAVADAVKNCIAVAESGTPDEAWEIASEKMCKSFQDGVIEPDMDRFFARVRELVEDIEKRHPKIIVEATIAAHSQIRSVYTNSFGVHFERTCGSYEVSIQFSAHEGDKLTSFFGSGFVTSDLDTPFIQCGTLEKDLTDVENQLNTVSVSEKFEGVLLAPPMCLVEFLMFTLNNFAGDNAILDGTSAWKDSLGKKVADEQLTVSVDPLDDRIICGERYTSIGHLSENYDVIREGVLNAFMLSQYVANKTGNRRAPNESSNLVVKSGNKTLDEIIKGIDKGIVVGRFSGGNPSSNGDFSGVAKNSFLIENGKITSALSETMISGNLADMLKNIVAISEETVCDGMFVVPYMAFGGVTVSGK